MSAEISTTPSSEYTVGPHQTSLQLEENFHPDSDVCAMMVKDRGIIKILDGSSGSLSLSDKSIVFSPPLYMQRYEKVRDAISAASRGSFVKVLDIGSAELKIFRYLRNITGVQEIILLDKDATVLEDNEHRVNPLVADYTFLRKQPLLVKVVCGDGRVYNPLFCGTDVVTMVELIEHMQVEDLPALVSCVFHSIKPKLVVVTTPNADFNTYFPDYKPGAMRHWDHKFEWSEKEFQKWCNGIRESFPEYTVEFSGCGLGPNNTYCTQVAIFQLTEEGSAAVREATICLATPSITTIDPAASEAMDTSPSAAESISVISEYDYPVDRRTQEQRDRDHILAKFHSLRQYLITSERSPNSLTQLAELDSSEDSSMDLNFLFNEVQNYEEEDTDDHLVFFVTDYYRTEEPIATRKVEKNDYIFFIIDEKYAVLPIKSVAKWVNGSSEHELPYSLISSTITAECFEINGSGDSWQGKIMLQEDCDDTEYEEDIEDGSDASDRKDWEDEVEYNSDWDVSGVSDVQVSANQDDWQSGEPHVSDDDKWDV